MLELTQISLKLCTNSTHARMSFEHLLELDSKLKHVPAQLDLELAYIANTVTAQTNSK